MGVLQLIIRREFLSKVRNKSFIIMTFLSPLLMIGLFVLVSYLTSQTTNQNSKIAVYDQTGIFLKQLENSKEITFYDVTPLGFKFAKENLSKNNYSGLLYLSGSKTDSLPTQFKYYSEENPSLDQIFKIEQLIENKLTQMQLVNAKVDLAVIEKTKADISLDLYNLSGKNSVKGLNEIKIFIGCAFGYLIMMFIVIYGNMVMRSVIEEKTSRIIEVIISSVKPFQLMLGKIIGTSLAGLLQYFIWVIIGLSLLTIVSFFMGSSVSSHPNSAMLLANSQGFDISVYINELFKLPIATILTSFAIYFIGGYLLYSSFYAAIGAAVDNETDSQQFLLPIISPLVLAIYVGFATVMNEPHGTIATVFSMVPFTSPIVMLMRIPFGVPLWEIAVSMLLLFTTFIAVVWLAAKIYRIGILMHGKKPSYSDLIKWLKY